MKKHIKTVLSLTAICAVVAILLAFTNGLTAPIIEKQQKQAVLDALEVVMPGADGFEAVDLTGADLPETVTEAYKEKNGGYVFKMITSGYGNGFVIMCGVDGEGKVTGARCIASNETLGAEADYGDKLVGADLGSVGSVDTVAGATRTTSAYRGAVKDALASAAVLSGQKAAAADDDNT